MDKRPSSFLESIRPILREAFTNQSTQELEEREKDFLSALESEAEALTAMQTEVSLRRPRVHIGSWTPELPFVVVLQVVLVAPPHVRWEQGT